MDIVLYIYITLNLVAFGLMGVDKFRAVHQGFRIPENLLLLFGLLGAVGAVCGALIFHHKTAKIRFRIFFSLELILHIVCIIIYCTRK